MLPISRAAKSHMTYVETTFSRMTIDGRCTTTLMQGRFCLSLDLLRMETVKFCVFRISHGAKVVKKNKIKIKDEILLIQLW